MRAGALAAILSAVLVAATFGSPSGYAADQGKKKKGAMVVGEDPAGDWGENADPTLGPLGDPLGQDLVAASIEMADKKTVNFIIGLNALPPNGGMPEFSRYKWSFLVDGEYVELDGKYTNYSRGACDPTSGQCPPPRDPGLHPFLVRGNCGDVGGVTTCEELGTVQATFDAASATITVPTPLDLIGAKKRSKIAPGTTVFGGSLYAAPSVLLTNNSMPLDTMVVTKTFRVPR
ncbi:MAG: hypothetical protein ACRDKB_11275 [Actinomycetota bacterium]